MIEISQEALEDKLTESVNNLHSDLNNLISQLNNNISLNSARSIPSFKFKEDFEKNLSHIFNEFTQYNPVYTPIFMKDKNPNLFLPKIENIKFFIQNFYKKAIDQLKEKEKIASRRISNINYISDYLDSFSHFVELNTLFIQQYQNSYFKIANSFYLSHEDYLSYIKYTISINSLKFLLNFLYKSFKYYSVINREKILTKAIDRFRSDILFVSTLSIPKTSDILEKEMKQASLFCGIPFECLSNDSQKFYYHCEKAFADIFLINVPIEFFDLAQIKNSNGNDEFSLIDDSISNLTVIDKGLIRSLKSIFSGNFEEMTKFLNDELFKFNLHKVISRDYLLSFLKIRFIKNKKTLIILFNNCKSFISLKSRLENREFSENEVNSLFQQNLHFIFTFASKLINKTFDELDYHSIIEKVLSLELRYEQSKSKIINALLTIYDHTNDDSINSLIIELIDKKPSLFYEPLRSYEKQFELNIDVFDLIGQCLWLMVNFQILNEQFNSPSTRENKDVYLLSNDSVPISRFEIFPNLHLILKFYKKAPFIAEEICESLSINFIRFNLHFTYAIWSCLLDEIKAFLNQCPFPFERTQIPYLTDDSFQLFSNKIFDNSEEIEKFFFELKNSEKIITFERNFIRLNKCILKLQNCFNLQHSLLPIYNKQLSANLVAPPFRMPNLTPEFLIDSNFDEKIESIYEEQVRFTKMLLLAVRFNNFQSDSLYIRNRFKLSRLHKDLLMHPYDEIIRNNLNEFICLSMFSSFDDFNVDKPLCDLSKSPSYSKYIGLCEIAFMAQLESVFFNYNPVKEYFNFSSQFYNAEANSISPFVIPTVSQCLRIPEEKIDDYYKIISSRIQICHLIRFESAIQTSVTQTFSSLASGKMQWNGGLLSHLLSEIESHPFINVGDAFEAFNSVLFHRINIAFLLTIYTLCQSINNNQKEIDNAKENWIEIHKSRSFPIQNDYLTLKRYRPDWIDLFLPNLFESTKKLLISQLSVVDRILADNLVMHSELKSHEILQNEQRHLLSILAYSILNSKEKLENCTIEKAVLNVSQADLIEHSTVAASSSSHFESSEHSFSHIPEEAIKKLIIQKQINDINEIGILINTKESINTISKPEFYNDQKTLLSQQAYIPPPSEITRQVNLEINYRFGKIIQKLKEFLRIKNLTKERLIELCKTVTPYLSIGDNQSFSIQYKNKKPIDDKIQTDIQRFCRTHKSYIRNACNELKANNENTALLDQLERAFKDDQQSKWQVKCSIQNSEKFLELNELREKLNERCIQQKCVDESIREKVTNEYESLLADLRSMIEEERMKFARYRSKLVGGMKRTIQSQILSDERIDCAIRTSKRRAEKNSDQDELTKSTAETKAGEFPKSQFIKRAEEVKPDSNRSPSLQTDTEEVKPDSKASRQFPKTQAGARRSEFPKLAVRNSSEDSQDKIERSELVISPNLRVSIDQRDIQKSELKFYHHVEFSPDSSRRLNHPQDDGADDNTECRRSRPPSSTAGLLVACDKRPPVPPSQPPQPPEAPPPIRGSSTLHPAPPKRRAVRASLCSAYMSQHRTEKVVNEIDLLRGEIIKIRIVHAMNLIAMERAFGAKIASAAQELREASASLWKSKRDFDEFASSIARKIDALHHELAGHESEIESIRGKIEKRRLESLRLVHWKRMNLRACDSMQAQLKRFAGTNNDSSDADVLALIRRVEESRAELEQLVVETDALEEQFDREVRVPMAEIDLYKRRIARTKRETAEIQYRAKMRNSAEEEEEEGDKEGRSKIERNDSDDDGTFLETSKFKIKMAENEEEDEIEKELEELEMEKLQMSEDYEDDIYEEAVKGQMVDGQFVKGEYVRGEGEINEIQKFRILNRKIAEENEELRRKIKEIEEIKERWKPELRESIEELTTEPQATPKTLISSAKEKKIVRPNVSPRRPLKQPIKSPHK